MEESYVRFLQLWPDGFWLWRNTDSADFDFATFIRGLDLAATRTNADTANPPTGQDGAFEYQAGHYREADGILFLSFVYRLGTASDAPLEIPWTGRFEIRSPVALWFDAAKARFDFVQTWSR